MPPSLGVLITYYNEGALLTECLDTLLSGPDKPDEILVYDDASHDPAERYIKPHHPVRILRGKENIGIGRARNELMQASQSDFIHFQDADDFFHPEWCRKVRDGIGEGEVDVVVSNVALVNLMKKEREKKRLYPLHQLDDDGDLLPFFFESRYILALMVTFRRSLGLKIGGYFSREIISVSEDFEFHTRLFALRPAYRVIDEPLVVKNKRPYSLIYDDELKLRREVLVSRLRVSQLLLSWLPSAYYPCLKKFLVNAWSDLLRAGEIEMAGACLKLADDLNVTTPVDGLADLCWKKGTQFFRAGDTPNARKAFELASRFGSARYAASPWLYRAFARMVGPELTERCARVYRLLMPLRLRRGVRRIFP